jgi:hypothetical protein
MRDRPLDCSWGETILGIHGGAETMRDRPQEYFGRDGDAKRPSSTSFMADGDMERPFCRKFFAGRRLISERRCEDFVLQKVHVRSVRQRDNKVHGETETRRVHPLEGLWRDQDAKIPSSGKFMAGRKQKRLSSRMFVADRRPRETLLEKVHDGMETMRDLSRRDF